MILLSDHAIKQSSGGQSLLGGLDVHVCRNYFGSQVRDNTSNEWMTVSCVLKPLIAILLL